MIKLFDDTIWHLPKEHISIDKCIYLGYVECYPTRLVVEDWEFRVYNYEERYDEDIFPAHQDEDWRAVVWDYIGNSGVFFDLDTLMYSVPKFESNNPLDMAHEILLACNDELEDVSLEIYDYVGWIPTPRFVSFIENWLKEIEERKNGKVYLYYK